MPRGNAAAAAEAEGAPSCEFASTPAECGRTPRRVSCGRCRRGRCAALPPHEQVLEVAGKRRGANSSSPRCSERLAGVAPLDDTRVARRALSRPRSRLRPPEAPENRVLDAQHETRPAPPPPRPRTSPGGTGAAR